MPVESFNLRTVFVKHYSTSTVKVFQIDIILCLGRALSLSFIMYLVKLGLCLL